MNKKGFTLIELLAVIALLAILVVIAVPVIGGVSSNIRGNMLRKKISLVEESAVLYGQDYKGSIINSKKKYDNYPCNLITVKTLVEEKYLDKDNDPDNCLSNNNCVVDPSDKENYLDNYEVIIYYRNNRIHSVMNVDEKTLKPGNLSCS